MRNKAMATLAALWMVLMLISGCKSYADPDPAPDPGSMRVTVTSFGAGLDPAGYDLAISGQQPQHVDRFAQVVVDLPPGDNDVLVSDLDGGQACQVLGDNPRRVSVATGEEARVSIVVNCDPGPHCDPLGGDCLRLPMPASGASRAIDDRRAQ